MFWDHPDWIELQGEELARAITIVRGGLDQLVDEAFVAPEELERVAGVVSPLVVQSVRMRRLPFQEDRWLYELTIALTSLTDRGLHGRYESARAFAVVGAAGETTAVAAGAASAPESPPHERPGLSATGLSVTLLDWTAGTIYGLNARARMRLQREGAFDRARTIEYLDFFVSFVATDAGNPFLIVRKGTLSRPAGFPRQRAELPSFESSITDHVVMGKFVRPPRHSFFHENGALPDDPDFMPSEEPEESVAQPPASKGTAAPAGTGPGADGGVLAEVRNGDTQVANITVAEGDTAEDTVGRSLLVTATVVHEGGCFAATFKVTSNDNLVTDVAMVEDRPLRPTEAALSRYRVDRIGRTATRFLLVLKPRVEIGAREFVERLGRALAGVGPAAASRVENLRVRGDVEVHHLAVDGPVQVRDVEFLGRVYLNDCRWPSSVTFEECKFARSVDARNATIEGDLVLARSKVFGVTADGDEFEPSVWLDGVRVGGSIQAEQIEVDGYVSLCNASIKGKLNLQGIDTRGRIDKRLGQKEGLGLLLRNARIEAGVDLSPFEVKGPRKRRIRSRVEGGTDLGAVRTSAIDLRGAMLSWVGLQYAVVEGLVDLSAADAETDAPTWLGTRMFRTRVADSVDARCAQTSEIFLIGASIGGALSMQAAVVDNSVFATPTVQGPYRCIVGGAVVLSGAEIGGDCDFGGAEVRGALEIRTGSIGRLFLEMSPVSIRGDKAIELDYFCTEVDQLEVIGVTGLKAVRLAGISVKALAGRPRPILFDHVRVLGDIRFYWGEGEDIRFRDQETVAAAEAQRLSLPEPKWRREASKKTCSATIAGGIEMRKIATEGHVDLTNVKITDKRGRVRLNDARIGTDLFARSSWLRGEKFYGAGVNDSDDWAGERLSLACAGLDLENAQIAGDAVLSGLDLGGDEAKDGRFSGRGLSVGGKLEFYAGRKHFARIAGDLDLNGAQVGHLSLYGDTFPDADAKPRAQLERARIGKLHICKPIPRLNLTGVKVTTWQVGDEDEAIDKIQQYVDVLERMHPMDRTVWIDVENMLRNQTRSRDADRLYRAMKVQENREKTVRRKAADPPAGEGPGGTSPQGSAAPGSPSMAVGPAQRRGAFESRAHGAPLSGLLDLASRHFFGYGTDVWPALMLAAVMASALFVVLLQPANVKASDGLVGQLNGQCGAESTRPPPRPAKCTAYFRAATADSASLDLSATDLPLDFGGADAFRLAMRYAVPVIGAFGEPDWVPEDQKSIALGARRVPLSPSTLALFVSVANTLLLSFAVAFITRRWLR